jgi:protein-L-isoaspartate(D-aspartate) O-methyltransferase
MQNNYNFERERMIRQDLVGRGIAQKSLITVMSRVKRELFVPWEYRDKIYRDGPIPIGYGQTISQPYIVAYMTELLELKGEERVLEIGTGSGYQTAILCELVREVYTIEVIKKLFLNSRELLLEDLKYSNLYTKFGNGQEGWEDYQPFDRILLTAAPDKVPHVLFQQLRAGGIMVAPVGNFMQCIHRYRKSKDGKIEREKLIGVSFVPFV